MSTEEHLSGVIVDLDGTIAGDNVDGHYSSCLPNLELIDRLHGLQRSGTRITIHTARNMRTFNGNTDLISLHTLPIISQWLSHHKVPYNEIVIGKPWPGSNGLYIDDRAIRPDELVSLKNNELLSIVKSSRWRG